MFKIFFIVFGLFLMFSGVPSCRMVKRSFLHSRLNGLFSCGLAGVLCVRQQNQQKNAVHVVTPVPRRV